MDIKNLQEITFEIEKRLRQNPTEDPILITMMKMIEETGELVNDI